MASTLVFYSIPSDHDDVEHPNVFILKRNPDDITVADIRGKFPLPGMYHFRFKAKLDNEAKPVWLDLGNDEIVPTFQKRIVMKVLRVSWNGNSATQTVIRPQVNQNPQSINISQPRVTSEPAPQKNQPASIDFFSEAPKSQQTTNISRPAASNHAFGDLFA